MTHTARPLLCIWNAAKRRGRCCCPYNYVFLCIIGMVDSVVVGNTAHLHLCIVCDT